MKGRGSVSTPTHHQGLEGAESIKKEVRVLSAFADAKAPESIIEEAVWSKGAVAQVAMT